MASDQRGLDVDRLIRLKRVSAIAPSPDGSWAAVAVQRLDEDEGQYVSDLWRISLVDPRIEPIQLTRGKANDGAPAFRRDGALAFLSSRESEDELTQVWLLPAGGGEPLPLTDEPLGVQGFGFAKSGNCLIAIAPVLPGVAHAEQRATARDRKKRGPSALHYRRGPVRLWDHWIPEAAPHLIAYDEQGGGRRDLTPGADREHRAQWFDVQFDVAAAGDRVVVTRASVSSDRLDDHALQIIDVASGAARVIGGAAAQQLACPRFSPDGSRIACQRWIRGRESAGLDQIWVYDVASGEGRCVAEQWDRSLNLTGWTGDGKALFGSAMDGGCEPVYRIDAQSGEVARITSVDSGGCHTGLHLLADGRTLIGLRHCFYHPPEPFRVGLEAGAVPRLLAELSGFSEAEGRAIARWESFTVVAEDGASVQSFALFPAQHSAGDAPLPGLMWIHGGPIHHNCDGWHWRWNALVPVAAGYALALPNPAGSTGFGLAYIDRIWRNRWGAECYSDLMRVADWMEAHPEIDRARIAAMGGSFGGYMANWIGGQTDRFKALVTHASLFALSQFHGPTDAPPFLLLELGCSPYDDPATFDRYSPHKFVQQWKTPTLVTHGERDYRVPISEGLTLFEALQMHGVESELLVFPDENHWILKPRNIAAWYRAWQDFIARHLDAAG